MQVSGETGDGYYVAWLECEHYSVRDKASFFVKHFQNMRWSILTHLTYMRWDGFDLTSLKVSPGFQQPKMQWINFG